MRRIGYARCSSQGQNLDRQIAALRAERCDVIFREKVSGKSLRNRPELEKAIDELGTGDTLIVAEWDRATRSMLDGVHLIERINTRGALIKVLDKPHLDLTTPLGRGFIAFLSAMAEDERQRILARCNAGRQVAIAKGVRGGMGNSPLSRCSSKPLLSGFIGRAVDRHPEHRRVLRVADNRIPSVWFLTASSFWNGQRLAYVSLRRPNNVS
jgi:DNA invertase Pin-like site-specific DNA recombinase